MRGECSVFIGGGFCGKPSVHSEPGCSCDECQDALWEDREPPHRFHWCADHYDDLMRLPAQLDAAEPLNDMNDL